MTLSTTRRRVGIAGAGALASVLVLTACAGPGSSGDAGGGGGSGSVIVGTTDKVTALDPAGSFDQGSLVLKEQVYPMLMNNPAGTEIAEPDIAESAEFTAPNEYTVKLKDGLTFANGNALTASDVKYSFDRMVGINHENGPAGLLYNLGSTAVEGDDTVVFTLNSDNDQVFPLILGSPAGYIVDEDVFPADALISDDDIVKANAFAGQYKISNYKLNNLVAFEANPDYQGVLGQAANEKAVMKYFATSSNMKLEVQEGKIDAAYRSLTATDVEDLGKSDAVKVHLGPGGEIRYLVFNFNTQPFGQTTPEASEERALVVRQAIADLIDREEIAEQVYKGTYTPLYTFFPSGLAGAVDVLEGSFGDGAGGPDSDRAKKRMSDVGITETVELNIQYSNDHYGPSSGDEFAMIKAQLEESGLFTVNLQTTEWVQYSKDRQADMFPIYQLGWFPDYADADNYVTGMFYEGGYVNNHFQSDELDQLIRTQASAADPAEREAVMGQVQELLGEALPTLPYLQGSQVVVAGKTVEGVTLDASFKFRLGTLHK